MGRDTFFTILASVLGGGAVIGAAGLVITCVSVPTPLSPGADAGSALPGAAFTSGAAIADPTQRQPADGDRSQRRQEDPAPDEDR